MDSPSPPPRKDIVDHSLDVANRIVEMKLEGYCGDEIMAYIDDAIAQFNREKVQAFRTKRLPRKPMSQKMINH